ncbi:hypothetical protein LTR97_006905 [Elasticomyces elasticus]|uniref:Uncharacterized protein n=1 Tax=Elasticomyces elasticus TaxID=574655 RepID=A0AAN7W9Q2_9PEZI|nr:hypothetical protein LTR97_006905 [Elasticomyces elasticus]
MTSASLAEGTEIVDMLHKSLKAKKSMRDFAASRVLPFSEAPTARQREPLVEEDEAMAEAKTEKAAGGRKEYVE